MKNNKVANSTSMSAIPGKKNPEKSIDLNDVIKMKFLEQSAQYFGVYVESRPADYHYMDEQTVN